MKKIFFCYILLICGTAKGQSLITQNNATDKDKKDSPVFEYLNGRYDLIIAYTEQCYWRGSRKKYTVLAEKNGNWYKITLNQKFIKEGAWSNPNIIPHGFSAETAKGILYTLTKNGFWRMNRDSLNVSERLMPNGQIQKFSISDGVNYRFEILSNYRFSVIESYEPQYFLKKMPELQLRAAFLKCVNAIKAYY